MFSKSTYSASLSTTLIRINAPFITVGNVGDSKVGISVSVDSIVKVGKGVLVCSGTLAVKVCNCATAAVPTIAVCTKPGSVVGATPFEEVPQARDTNNNTVNATSGIHFCELCLN